jgi:hypothetical protein
MNTNLKNFINYDMVRDKIKNTKNNIWLNKSIINFSECNEYDFDSSFFNDKNRVFNKYKSIPGFERYNTMSLNELTSIVQPTSTRTIILGTTEYLLPYVAYCVKFITEKGIDIETGEKSTLPFLFYAPDEWTMKGNINFIDCISNYYKQQKYPITVFLPKDQTKWVDPQGQPRVTILELYRLVSNIIDNIQIKIDDSNAEYYKISIISQSGGKKRNKISKMYKRYKKHNSKKNKSRKHKSIKNHKFHK